MPASKAFIEERAWLARFRTGPEGPVCGAGFAIDERHVLTCAHVVLDAGASGPGDSVLVEFPLLGAESNAEVLAEGWAEPPVQGGIGDTALLRLTNPPAAMAAVPLRSLRSVDGHRFSCYGFPAGYDNGQPTEGHLGKAADQEWVKIEVDSAVHVDPGFSGAAVWSEDARAVVAMVSVRDRPTEGRVAFAIPVRVVAGRSAVVAQALLTPLELDPDLATHWSPRSRGVASDADAAGWLFNGRRRALVELVGWLSSEPGTAMRVVTGSPGSGKSALLARLVTTSDKHFRRRVPGLSSDDPTVPPEGSLSATFHAKDRTVAQLVAHLALVTDVEADTPEALLTAFDDVGHWPVVAVDALDESTEPKAMARLLVDLAERGARVLVGTRDHLLNELSDPDPMRVDHSPYLEAGDVEHYVSALLAAAPSAAPLAQAEVAELVDAAEGNFLVAQLVARAIALGGHRERPFPRQVRQAFERYLDALPDPDATRDLLLPMAYAFGDGLPADELWLAAVAALRRPYSRADLDDLLASPAGAFLIARLDDAGTNRHRLFHQALGNTLAARRDPRRDHELLWRSWLEMTMPAGPTGRSWLSAPAYLCQHAADHAVAAGALTELANDVEYLLVADLDRLLVRLGQPPGDAVPEMRAIVRLAADRARRLATRRRGALLALAARHLGLERLSEGLMACCGSSIALLWAHRLGHQHQPLTGHTGWVTSVALGQLGGREVVVSGGDDGTVRVWDPARGRAVGEPLTGHDGGVASVALGQVGGREVVVSGGDDGTVRVWAAASGHAVSEPLTGHDGGVASVALGQLGGRDVVVSGGHDGTVRVWDAANGQAVGEPLTGHCRGVTSVALGQVGGSQVVVSGGYDRTVRVWDAASGHAVGAPLTGHDGWVTSVALGQLGGREVVVSGGYDATVRVWDVASGHAVGEPLTGHYGKVTSVALGQVGGREVVVSGGSDGTVRVWAAASGQAVGEPLTGHDGWVTSVALGQVGGREVVVSGGWDGTVRVWEIEEESSSCAEVIDFLAPVLSAQVAEHLLVAATGRALCAFTVHSLLR